MHIGAGGCADFFGLNRHTVRRPVYPQMAKACFTPANVQVLF